jgi:signal peptidase I
MQSEEAENPTVFREIRRWARDLAFAVLAALVIVVFFYQPVKVEGTSMLPELVDQERIFVNKFVYRIDRIERGDIVVFRYPLDASRSYIKRVIGVPGDLVEIRRGRLWLNGEQSGEAYVPAQYFDPRSFAPVRVDRDAYFVMGDHRNQSNDSRMWGLVPEPNIYGKAVFRYWPVNKMGTIE